MIKVISNIFNKFNIFFPQNFKNVLKNIFAIIGLISSIYFLIFWVISKPQYIKDSEKKVENLEGVIKENNKEITKLHKENEKIEGEVKVLEKSLDELQDKSEKYKKQYEKQVTTINSLTNNELSKLFTDTFLEYTN
jgi:septal ring factor EnvC (AmiA/AmiB activator)